MSENPKLLDLQFDTTKEGTEITLRDLFQAFAYHALRITNPTASSEVLARESIEEADALLAERAKEKP